ncbi:protein argonaute 1-like [Corylus avellana]|uniref:protein argonaute 1-like n=1 Tax=Corylus avellana TaxID=13451 RepID=UPI00286A1BAD|nr:protein argonaute 1-like [Corylus avellana]
MPRRRRGRGRGGGGGQGGGGSGPGAPPGSSPPAPPTAFLSVAPPATSFPATPSAVASPAGPPPLALASRDSSVASSSALPLVSDSTSVAPLSREIDDKLTLLQVPAPLQFPFTFPKRPGYGTIGKRIAVRANHFLVEVADRDLHHYAVSITPAVTSKKINRVIINQLVNLYKESHLGSRSPAYDGWSNLYTAGPLPFKSMDFVIKLIENDDHRASSSCSVRKEYRFIVTIKFISRADIHHLRQFLSGRQLDAPQETIQALSVVLKATSSEKYNVVGRSFFHPELGRMGELAGNGIEYWRGYYQSLRLTQMGLSLCIDVSVQPFYEPILVIEFLAKHFNFHFSSSMPDQDRQKVSFATIKFGAL